MSRPVHGGARRTQGLASGNGSAGGGEAFDVDAENRHLDGGVDAGMHGWDARGAAATWGRAFVQSTLASLALLLLA